MRRPLASEARETDGHPEILYKYLTLKRAEPILRESKLYFASPLEFNDPFDCKAARMSFRALTIVKEQYLRELLKKREPHLPKHERNRKVRQVLQNRGNEVFEKTHARFLEKRVPAETAVLCLSEKNDDILMWSHYAYGHTGVCLGFRVFPAVSDFTLPQSDSQGFFGNAMRVKYSDNLPLLNFFKIVAGIRDTGPEGDRVRRLFVTALYLTKATHWSYEQEWRLVIAFRGMACKGSYGFPPELLKEVRLGCQVASEEQRKVVQWIREGHTSPVLYRARKRETEFGVDFDAL
jgi:hypothetical protein